MNVGIEALRGKLAGLREKKKKLELRIEGNARHLCQGLNTLLTPPAELEVLLLDEQFDELKSAWGELQVVLVEISKIERALR